MKNTNLLSFLFIQISGSDQTSAVENLYIFPNGSDQWSGTLASAKKDSSMGHLNLCKK